MGITIENGKIRIKTNLNSKSFREIRLPPWRKGTGVAKDIRRKAPLKRP